ncbi:bifunctional folylpolyglutamate synthase/dihydrofolate synthase [Ferroacidibacillus organovorans]|uniref:Mur ligase central domain-containing protein n=1 Tax=Ferroacidibacillus organovorans TaxID=1765683 RepID=A0A162UF96_9BACL|nr:Mur ligase family protein [Ferroacidibacillus organovorans]KYP81709.1 hypothetical protein AYJ22_06210 [Ferroacidibacillus organovorans]OAG94246.1 hypothetical protein AYW79_06420 [Ferroacidibacillus organovorans]OPG16919.1 hypothetical protein B2M26_04145 [Ferroacidibacillus organovorans]
MFSTFYESVAYLYQSYNDAKKKFVFGYDRETRTPHYTRILLDSIGAPDQHTKTIKITGSKGKGTTSRFTARLLQSQGNKVGLFTSPHMVDFTERIRIDGKAISEDDFMAILSDLVPAIEQIRRELPDHAYLGPVGILAVVAARYFYLNDTDVNVFELGRGARHDDVNQVRGDMAILTPIRLEHKEQLGPTLNDVVWEKAGIIQAGASAIVSASQLPEVTVLLKQQAEAQGVPLFSRGIDFHTDILSSSIAGSHIRYWSKRGVSSDFELTMPGEHAIENASVAMFAVELFLKGELRNESWRNAMREVSVPGRAQWLPGTSEGRPAVLLDGTIHRDSAREIVRLAKSAFASRVGVILAVPEDKDYEGVIEAFAEIASFFIITRAANPHLVFSPNASAYARQYRTTLECATLAESVHAACQTLGTRDLLIIAGTQSLIGDALQFFSIQTRDA